MLAWRVRRQHLAARSDEPLGVVSDIAGMHAQVLSSAELTLWARVEGLSPGWLDDALWERRSLVKTWAMRGTLHLLRADELARLDARRRRRGGRRRSGSPRSWVPRLR